MKKLKGIPSYFDTFMKYKSLTGIGFVRKAHNFNDLLLKGFSFCRFVTNLSSGFYRTIFLNNILKNTLKSECL